MQRLNPNISKVQQDISFVIDGGESVELHNDQVQTVCALNVFESPQRINFGINSEESVGLQNEQAQIIRAISPTVDLERVDDGVQITVTDINGTETEVIHDGQTCQLDTTANWNARVGYVPHRGDVIVYTDHGQMDDGYGNSINVPGVKIGDGNAYLIDLPFVGADVRYQILTELRAHSGNTLIHVTPEDRAFWNNKINCTVSGGNLILNRL